MQVRPRRFEPDVVQKERLLKPMMMLTRYVVMAFGHGGLWAEDGRDDDGREDLESTGAR